MRAGHWAVAVAVVLVSTSAFAKEGSGRSRGDRSGRSNSGGTAVTHRSSSASSSRSGHASQYRSTGTRYSTYRGASTRYRTGGERSYGRYRYSSPRYGYRSYYRPGFSLYLGAPLYYDNNYPGYYPEAYATAPYTTAPYATAPYPSAPDAPDYGYSAPADEDADTRPQADDRDFDAAADASDSSRWPLDVRPADATIYVDGQFRGTADSDPVLLLTPGRHTVEVARPGYRSERRVVDVGSGDGRSLSITLQPASR
jgi:PEGA domain